MVAATLSRTELSDAARRLHAYLEARHWTGRALQGPDSGIRFNARLGRFVKSYLPLFRWSDDLRYNQAQGYWIAANWRMVDLFDHADRYAELASAATDFLLEQQHPDGYWPYPNPEWKHRIATVEGNFASLSLLETYQRTKDERLLEAALRWHRFLLERIGFQGSDGLLAVNYFANKSTGMVPNNSTLTVRTLAKFAQVTGHERFLEQCPAMLAWLGRVQRATGEFPYVVESDRGKGRSHFLCYQYNAFEFLDLVHYYDLTEDPKVWPILEGLARYLEQGILTSGAARFDCHSDRPEVVYYTAAVGAALGQASARGIGDFNAAAGRAYGRVLDLQRDDGGMRFFSHGNYGVLTDRRSYPRNLAMILYHLLLEIEVRRSR
jgi:hypothetical protein